MASTSLTDCAAELKAADEDDATHEAEGEKQALQSLEGTVEWGNIGFELLCVPLKYWSCFSFLLIIYCSIILYASLVQRFYKKLLDLEDLQFTI